MTTQQIRRKQVLETELTRIVRVLKDKYEPEKVILYGSLARNKVRQWSDLDVVIVKNTPKRFYDRIGEVLTMTDPNEAVDFLVYTPEEFQDMQQYSRFIGEEVIKKGKVLYDKNS